MNRLKREKVIRRRRDPVDNPNEIIRTSPPYRIKRRYQSYNRVVKPGEVGAWLSDANGYGRFFPDKGGYVEKVAASDVERIVSEVRREVRRGVMPAALAHLTDQPKPRKVRRVRRVRRIRRGA